MSVLQETSQEGLSAMSNLSELKESTQTEHRESIMLKNQGQKIFGILHKPVTETPFPLVIICHGLGGHKVGRYRLYVSLATQLTARGIGALRFDFRGSGDSDGEFSEMTLETQVSDVEAVFNYVSQHPEVDTNRVGVMGRSFGGAVTVLGASRTTLIKSICLWAPVFNGLQWSEKWKQYQAVKLTKKMEEELMTIDGQIPGIEFYRQFFNMHIEEPLHALDNRSMLIIHGSQDHTVHVDNGEKYLRERRQATGLTRFIQLPHSDHDFTHMEERHIALNQTTEWFQETL